jgi:hypothetical protein
MVVACGEELKEKCENNKETQAAEGVDRKPRSCFCGEAVDKERQGARGERERKRAEKKQEKICKKIFSTLLEQNI